MPSQNAITASPAQRLPPLGNTGITQEINVSVFINQNSGGIA